MDPGVRRILSLYLGLKLTRQTLETQAELKILHWLHNRTEKGTDRRTNIHIAFFFRSNWQCV